MITTSYNMAGMVTFHSITSSLLLPRSIYTKTITDSLIGERYLNDAKRIVANANNYLLRFLKTSR